MTYSGCCNTCNGYQFNEHTKFSTNEQIYSNIVYNGCLLCNNEYYNQNNKKIYERSFFNGMTVPPCNIDCQVNLEFKLKNGQKS